MTRLELMALSPPTVVRSLLDLSEADNLWVTHVEVGAKGHRSYDRRTSVCGAPIGEWSVTASQLTRLCGQLCPSCWSPQANETPADPGR